MVGHLVKDQTAGLCLFDLVPLPGRVRMVELLKYEKTGPLGKVQMAEWLPFLRAERVAKDRTGVLQLFQRGTRLDKDPMVES